MQSDELASFQQFVAQQLASVSTAQMSPERVLALWREREESLAAIRCGLVDVDAGRTMSLEGFDREFSKRHGNYSN